jgi:hypothetical protein
LFCATGVIARFIEASDIQVVHLETGKSVAKTAIAAMKNGNCQWQDPVVESMQLQLDQTTNEYEENFYKLLLLSSSVIVDSSGLLYPHHIHNYFGEQNVVLSRLTVVSFPVMFSLNVPHNKGSNCR